MHRIGSIVSALLLGLGLLTPQAPAQTEEIMSAATDALMSIAEGRRTVAELGREVHTARAWYWHAYDRDEITAEIRQRYEIALLEKDLFCLFYQRSQEQFAMDGMDNMATAIRLVTGGLPDGGIDPLVRDSLSAWVTAGRKFNDGAGGDQSTTLLRIIAQTQEEFNRYRRDRDAVEYAFKSGLDPLESVDHRVAFPALLFLLGACTSIEAGEAIVHDYETRAGSGHIERAASGGFVTRMTRHLTQGVMRKDRILEQLDWLKGEHTGVWSLETAMALTTPAGTELPEAHADWSNFEVETAHGRMAIDDLRRAYVLLNHGRASYQRQPLVFVDASGKRYIAGEETNWSGFWDDLEPGDGLFKVYPIEDEIAARPHHRKSIGADEHAWRDSSPAFLLAAGSHASGNGIWLVTGGEGYLPPLDFVRAVSLAVLPLTTMNAEELLAATLAAETERTRLRSEDVVTESLEADGLSWMRPTYWERVDRWGLVGFKVTEKLTVIIKRKEKMSPLEWVNSYRFSTLRDPVDTLNGLEIERYEVGGRQAYEMEILSHGYLCVMIQGEDATLDVVIFGVGVGSHRDDLDRFVRSIQWNGKNVARVPVESRDVDDDSSARDAAAERRRRRGR